MAANTGRKWVLALVVAVSCGAADEPGTTTRGQTDSTRLGTGFADSVSVWRFDDGEYVADPASAPAFYAELAHDYRRGAEQLTEALERGEAPSPTCDASVVEAMGRMAERAERLGG